MCVCVLHTCSCNKVGPNRCGFYGRRLSFKHLSYTRIVQFRKCCGAANLMKETNYFHVARSLKDYYFLRFYEIEFLSLSFSSSLSLSLSLSVLSLNYSLSLIPSPSFSLSLPCSASCITIYIMISPDLKLQLMQIREGIFT